MLIPFTVPRTAFNYLPSCDTIIFNFPFRLTKSRLRRLLRLTPTGGCLHSQLLYSILEKGVGQIRLLFLHCEGKSAALSQEGLTVGALIHRWISLVRANGNAVQRTVRSGRTMVCALAHRISEWTCCSDRYLIENDLPFVISGNIISLCSTNYTLTAGNAFRCAILKQKTLQ